MTDPRAWDAPKDLDKAVDLAVQLAKEGKLNTEELELIGYNASDKGDTTEFLDRLEQRLSDEGLTTQED